MVGVAGRSKGCNTCRKRRVKCDEAKPQCYRCIKAGFECLGYQRATQWRHTSLAPVATSRLHMSELADIAQPLPVSFVPPPELSLGAFERDMCTAHMFGNFVWRSYGSLWLNHACEGKLGNLSLDAVTALSQLSFGLNNRVQELQLKGAAQYGRCLRILAEELRRDNATAYDNRRLVVPILVLMMVSAIQTDRTGAVFHLKAIEKVLILCGPGAFQQQPLRNAFEAARATLLIASLFSKRRIFLEDPRWQDVPYALDPYAKPQQSRLLDILVAIPGLLEENARIDSMGHYSEDDPAASPLASDKRLICRENLCEYIILLLGKLFRWRWDWQREYGQYVSTESYERQSNDSPTDSESIDTPEELGRLRFDRCMHANDVMLYNSALMWLMTLLWKLKPLQTKSIIQGCAQHAATSSTFPPQSPTSSHVSFEPLSEPGSAFSIRDPALEICRVFDWQCRHHNQCGALDDQACLYLFPVGMARSVLGDEPYYQQWIDDMLDSTPITAGYGRHGGSIVGFSSYITRYALNPDVYG
ncbi:hypothetical protein F4811DRAFT_562729 [Daldinia bambusicola]|nr:hypothetical protein F4811DRAFT_562729 [Daldinia bambusicola]